MRSLARSWVLVSLMLGCSAAPPGPPATAAPPPAPVVAATAPSAAAAPPPAPVASPATPEGVCAARVTAASRDGVVCIERGSAPVRVQWGGALGLVRLIFEPRYGFDLLGLEGLTSGKAIDLPKLPAGRKLGGLSSDGERLLVVDDNLRTENEVVSFPDGKRLARVVLENVSCVHCPMHDAFHASPDLRHLARAVAVARNEQESKLHLELVDVGAGGTKRRLPLGTANLPDGLAVSPDGRQVAVWHPGQTLTLWDVARAKPSRSVEIQGFPQEFLFLQDGKTGLVRRQDGAPQLVDLATGTVRDLPDVAAAAELREFASLSPVKHGARVLVGDRSGAYLVLDPSVPAWLGSVHAFADGSWVARDVAGRVAGPDAGMAHVVVAGPKGKAPAGADAGLSRVSVGELLTALGLE